MPSTPAYHHAYRERRKSIGLCTWSGCATDAVLTMTLCPQHREANKHLMQKRERFRSRRTMGLCVASTGCRKPLVAGRLRCTYHLAKQKGYDRAVRERKKLAAN